MATTVTTKGQVTIPKEVRDLLGIKPGSAVTFEVAEDGRVVLSKAGGRRGSPARPSSRFAKLRGRATAGMTTDEIMALTRGEE
ncbi:AbrB/MazE/SpoVT family DNA-binding domain-containing protein [Elioraea sp.]|jgi:antitoxin PrlF|uniref:AbrB/MazE/SpoVT family DNA-binding domain-containing protein n=1 Tax=Elioraea sp. TaxID=2185103 RepID=UPI001D8FE8BF|nr:AbrB/MazE/SpoVT family DNA-binding domain-containing protein [Acetobacteraceae bacterium]